MSSSDEFNLAEFGITENGDTLTEGQNSPDWNIFPESIQTSEVQWLEHERRASLWQPSAPAPVFQPTFNQAPPASTASVPVMHTNHQNYQFIQNCQFLAMNTPFQYQQVPVNHTMMQPNHLLLKNIPSKHHQAHVTIVRNPNGPPKAIIKRKRNRTAFTTEQVLALEKVYSKKQYVNFDDRQALVQQLQVTDRAIKVWFQNRRIKTKREELEAREASSDYSPMGATDSSDSFGLAYVEAQMSQKTDEFGYVTLDNRAIGELVNVIDGLVGENVSCEALGEKEVVENVLQMEYEPVSPAAHSDSSVEEAANWRRPDPEQSLRQLLDLQNFC